MQNEINSLRKLLPDLQLPCDFDKNLLAFSDFFLQTANTLNLTAIKQPHEVMIKHYYDSIYPLTLGLIKNGDSVIDIGCGGGFPSMPLKLALPQNEFLLLDSLKKRLTFLDNAISLLQLQNIKTLHARAEVAAHNEDLRDNFDIAVSRAVAPLNLLCELCLPFVKVGGVFLAYKGKGSPDEISSALPAIAKLSAKLERVYDFDLPEDMGARSIVVIKKVKPTHPSLPRSTKNMSKGAL